MTPAEKARKDVREWEAAHGLITVPHQSLEALIARLIPIYERAARLRAHEEAIGRLRAALTDVVRWYDNPRPAPRSHIELHDRDGERDAIYQRARDALAAAPPGEYEQRVRREALEEAAKLVEGNAWKMSTRFEDAAAIRALASKDDARPTGK